MRTRFRDVRNARGAEWTLSYIFILHFLDISSICIGSYAENLREERGEMYIFAKVLKIGEGVREGGWGTPGEVHQ